MKILFICLAFGLTLAKPSLRGGQEAGYIKDLQKGYTPTNRIIGGDEVVPHSIPYQISLQHGIYSMHFCGASIIDKDTVLTSAHCCMGESPGFVKVVAGAHNLRLPEESVQIRQAVAIHGHSGWNYDTSENDICVIKLDKPLQFNRNVAPVKLAEAGSDNDYVGDAIVTGWGLTDPNTAYPSHRLRKVSLNVVTDDDCRKAMVPAELHHFKIFDSHICGSGKGVGVCYGDAGGPLTCSDDTVQCGLVSWARYCYGEYPYSVFTQVSYFRDWIKNPQ